MFEELRHRMIAIDLDTLQRATIGTLAVIYGGALSLTLSALFCRRRLCVSLFQLVPTIVRRLITDLAMCDPARPS
jgi:hypothetical protein